MGNRAAKVSEDSKRITMSMMLVQRRKSTLLLVDSKRPCLCWMCVRDRVSAPRFDISQTYSYAGVYGMGNSTKGQLGLEGKTCSPPQIIADGDLAVNVLLLQRWSSRVGRVDGRRVRLRGEPRDYQKKH